MFQDPQTRHHRATYAAELVQQLNNAGFHTTIHNDGVRVTLSGGPLHPSIYIHALPWSRGWSVFVSDRPDEGVFDWREAPAKYKALQRPIYVKRNDSGPENVPYASIVAAVAQVAHYIRRLAEARHKRFNKAHWYWPKSALEGVIRESMRP